jgi:hypothetical protein|tara:strand:+ start:393 stop:776 length:384 start_codon:yes stop_codon:yes gene_type:complete
VRGLRVKWKSSRKRLRIPIAGFGRPEKGGSADMKKTINQMSRQMDITKEKAGNLMSKAKKMNSNKGYKRGGTVILMSLGSIGPSMDMMRRKDDYHDDTYEEDESLIQSTENQVQARHFNNNDGKGTF